MKRINGKCIKYIVVFTLIILMTGIAGCEGMKNEEIGIGGNRIIEFISISTAEKNPDNIWHICWPAQGYYTSYGRRNSFISINEITAKEEKYIVKYLESLTYDRSHTDTKDFLAEITIYYNNHGTHELCSKEIYGEYPEGFDEFAELINHLCGDDRTYLYCNNDIQEVTPEYFKFRAGIEDVNVYGGSIQDLIDYFELDMKKLSDSYDCYREKAHAFELMKLLPFKIESRPSTDDEAYDYACKLAENLDFDRNRVKKYKSMNEGYEYYAFMGHDFKEIRVYRTEDMNVTMGGISAGYDQYRMTEDVTEPGDEFSRMKEYEFSYSTDYKFAVAVEFEYADDFYDRFKKLGEVVKSIK